MAVTRRHDMGAGGYCICPKCGKKTQHQDGVRCQDEKCPQCGAKMLREHSHHHQLLEEKRAKKKGDDT